VDPATVLTLVGCDKLQAGRFALHFVEMCAPMCIGFAVGDLVYLGLAARAGYPAPSTDLPVLSVVVVTLSMTAPMTAWCSTAVCRGARSSRCPLRCRSSPSRSS
jgi:hypothetical protein